MAVLNTPKRLCAPTALTGSEATLYTASGSGLAAIIRNIHLCNTIGADRQVFFATGSTATPGNMMLSGVTVPANDILSLDVYIGLNATETFRAYSSGSGGVTVQIMGVE